MSKPISVTKLSDTLLMTNIINGFDFGALPIKTTFVGRVEDKEWPHYLWNVSISYNGGIWIVPFKTGLGMVVKAKHQCAPDKPKTPTNADIIYALLMDISAEDMSFTNWCMEYGYDDDSMKAFHTYQTCCEYAIQMKKTFTREKIKAMQKALGDY